MRTERAFQSQKIRWQTGAITWLTWVGATVLGCLTAVVLGTTLTASGFGAVVIAVLGGVAVGGLVQWLVLRQHGWGGQAWRWLVVTELGYPLALLVGSLFFLSFIQSVAGGGDHVAGTFFCFAFLLLILTSAGASAVIAAAQERVLQSTQRIGPWWRWTYAGAGAIVSALALFGILAEWSPLLNGLVFGLILGSTTGLAVVRLVQTTPPRVSRSGESGQG
jgi:hypothetical protein